MRSYTMKQQDRYIMFRRNIKGNDGYKYIANVKYKKKESSLSLYLPGKVKMKFNKFKKSSINNYVIGKIIKDGR